MKKILLASILASSIFSYTNASENIFYISTEVGGAIPVRTKSSITDEKFKNSTHFNLAASFGYIFSENLRVDLKYTQHFNSKSDSILDQVPNKIEHHSKSNISSLILSSYYDILDFEIGKLYFGAGAGTSIVSDKQEYRIDTTQPNLSIANIKRKFNFSYRLTTGINIALSDNVELDLSYSFNDYGKTRSSIINHNATDYELSNKRIRTNNFSAGIRLFF